MLWIFKDRVSEILRKKPQPLKISHPLQLIFFLIKTAINLVVKLPCLLIKILKHMHTL